MTNFIYIYRNFFLNCFLKYQFFFSLGLFRCHKWHSCTRESPRGDALCFRGRKDLPNQNVFAACDFDMKFTYVLVRWEGTASDSRIL